MAIDDLNRNMDNVENKFATLSWRNAADMVRNALAGHPDESKVRELIAEAVADAAADKCETTVALVAKQLEEFVTDEATDSRIRKIVREEIERAREPNTDESMGAIIADLRAEKKRWEENCWSVNSANVALRTVITKLEGEVAALTERNADLAEKYGSCKKLADIVVKTSNERLDQIDKLTKERDEIRASYGRLNESSGLCEGAIERLTKERDYWKEKWDIDQKNLEKAWALVHGKAIEISCLKSDLATANAEIARMREEIKQLRTPFVLTTAPDGASPAYIDTTKKGTLTGPQSLAAVGVAGEAKPRRMKGQHEPGCRCEVNHCQDHDELPSCRYTTPCIPVESPAPARKMQANACLLGGHYKEHEEGDDCHSGSARCLPVAAPQDAPTWMWGYNLPGEGHHGLHALVAANCKGYGCRQATDAEIKAAMVRDATVKVLGVTFKIASVDGNRIDGLSTLPMSGKYTQSNKDYCVLLAPAPGEKRGG